MASSSSAAVGKRLIKELASYRKEPNPCLASLDPVSEDDLTHWLAVLKGSDGTAYEGGQWKIDVKIPANYPLAPPTMTFLTPICHPNVHLKVQFPPPSPPSVDALLIQAQTGEVCLDLLKTAWSPAYTISSTLSAIHQLLTTPEPDSPLNVDAAAVLRSGDNVGYESLVRLWTVLHAGRPPTFS